MSEGPDSHQKFRELCALSNSGTLSARESRTLHRHLHTCTECREVHEQFRRLADEGMPLLAESYSGSGESPAWDGAAARRKLFARIRAATPASLSQEQRVFRPAGRTPWLRSPARWAQSAIAAGVIIAATTGAYRLGNRMRLQSSQPVFSQQNGMPRLIAEKQAADVLLDSKSQQLAQLLEQSKKQQQEIDRLRLALRGLQDHSTELTSARSQAEEKLRAASKQGEALANQLQDAQKAYQTVESELASLRTARDHDALQSVTLQARIDELTSLNRDQERRLKDTEQFLASDRDIRELMGARKLYIADVFDVDSGSRTKKPFGRVFYTQNKSLIFYAFDLDHQPGIKNASIFQVWGQRETALGEQAHPLNLGILYMDNEANRRWVLRSDDPRQLNEIDAVFVTVEPHGGSQKPTGKPFLFALLRKEANHP